ncbi:hypothetical protein D3C73_1538510 [compost metagenome]
MGGEPCSVAQYDGASTAQTRWLRYFGSVFDVACGRGVYQFCHCQQARLGARHGGGGVGP